MQEPVTKYKDHPRNKNKGIRKLEKLAATDLIATLGPFGGLYNRDLTGT